MSYERHQFERTCSEMSPCERERFAGIGGRLPRGLRPGNPEPISDPIY